MFIWGKQDIFAPPTLGEELARFLPNIPMTFIDEAGHHCQTDQPDLVSRIIVDFFQRR
jgi:pimeloyl-ACP methyl ester carboxylesterase